jgi:DNA-binding XRE family transcriptional regulator
VPDIARLLKDEIRRVTRKELKQTASELKQSNVALRRAVSDLKQRVGKLEREKKRLTRGLERQGVATPPEAVEEAPRLRATSNTIRMLREKLGLTQAELAVLLGVTGQSVYQWEAKGGRLQLRTATRAALAEIRGIGKREAHKKLEDMGILAESRRGPRGKK